jgi:hypothetical protein
LEECDRGGGVVQDRVDQEAAVSGDVVLLALGIVHAAANDPGWKQHHRRARLQRRSGRRDRSRHHLAIRPNVVQLRPELSADGDRQSFLFWGVELLGLYWSVNIRSKNAGLLNLADEGYFDTS